MGLCYFNAIEDAEKARRGEPVVGHGGVRGGVSTPEIGTASASCFFALLGVLFIHRITGMRGRVLWLPLGLATIAAVAAALILVALEFGEVVLLLARPTDARRCRPIPLRCMCHRR